MDQTAALLLGLAPGLSSIDLSVHSKIVPRTCTAAAALNSVVARLLLKENFPESSSEYYEISVEKITPWMAK